MNYASTASVTFTSADYSTVQTVTVAAASDVNSTHETETITVSVATGSAAEYVSKAMPLTENVIVADDDTSAGVTVTPVTLEVGEGDTATYSVVLDALPSAPVAVSVTSGDAAVATVVPAQLVFDASDWSTAQTVTVTGVADDADMADGSAAVAHAVLATYFSNGTKLSALEYAALATLPSVAVSVVDDDRPSVSVSELSVDEGGMGTYTVVLNVEPASDVVIDVALADGSDSDVTVSPSSLTFTASGSGIWSDPQTVTVSAAEDDDSTDDTATVTHVVDNDDSDNAYDDVPIESVAVTVTDNDEADTTVDLVKNTGQTAASGASFEIPLEDHPVAQSFTTGAHTRYELDSIGFSFQNIADASTAGSELTVRLNEDSSGSPGRTLCILEDPPSFASSGTHTFTAPTTGANRCPQLSANTTYFAVLERAGHNEHEITPHLTQSSSEDEGGSPGWTVADSNHSYTTAFNLGWSGISGQSHMIEVRGSVSTEVEVPPGWSLIPSGLSAGDTFRLLFVTGTANPTATDIADYNTFVQTQAAAGHADIADYSSWFRVVGSTAATDARDNTGTTYTADDKGVPVYWLDGVKVADDYENFYDGGWDDEANPKGADGATVTVDRVFTGSTSAGTEADASTESGSTTTVSRALGANPARVGRLNNSSSGPLDSSEAYTTTTNYPYYALSGVMVVGEAVNYRATGVPTISGTVSVNEVLTAVTSGIMDPDGTASATFTYQWVRIDGMTESIVGMGSSTYTLVDADIGKTIKVKVTFSDDEGNAEGPLSSKPTVVVNGPATGAPTISGTPRVGKTLTAATTDIADPNGTSSATFVYQWVRVDGMTEGNVGTDSSTYTLVAADIDKTIKVNVRFSDDEGVSEGPLESLATESVVAGDVLVQNTAKPAAASPAELTSANSRYGQRFTTGGLVVGYTLSSIGVLFTEIGDTSTVGTELTVTLNAESGGLPGEALCTLSDPAAFFGAGLHAFSVPTTGTDLCPELAPSTTYFVVLSRANGNTDAIKWSPTDTLGEDSGSLAGWSIDDRGHFYNDTSSTWSQLTSAENLLIEVKGAVDNAITVPVDWSLLPADVTNGDRFRLLFVTGIAYPHISNIATYNALVQNQAAAGHTDIVDYSHWFRVLGSTTSVDARDNTDTTYTDDDKGVPIYWLNGVKVVDDYEDFYDGDWDNEANPRGADGNPIGVDRVWTGSTDAGTEAFDGSNSLAIGTSFGLVGTGRPNGAGGPIDSNEAFTTGTNWRFYALSGLFEVGEGNLPPRFSAETATRTLPENSAAGVSVVGGVITATDRDSGDTPAYTLTGTDAGSFDIDSSGQITTKTGVAHSFDFEDASNNSFSVTVTVSDGKDVDGAADTAVDDTIAVTIDLTNVNEAPVITTTSAAFTAFNVDENTATSAVVKTYEATDADADTTLTWSLEGTDAGDFTITKNAQGHGELKFASVPDFETPADDDTMNDYDVTVKVTDNGIPDNRAASNQLDDSVSVTATVDDVNEGDKVIVSVSELSVAEAGTATYTVVLGQAPASDVVIDIAASGDLSVSTDGMNYAATGMLTFTASGSGIWSTPQTVTVKAASDDDSVDDTATVTHTVDDGQSDNDFDGETIASVAVTVTDDDPVGITLSKTSLALQEGNAVGGSGSYTVELASQPTGDVVVDISVPGLESYESVTVMPTQLTFEADDWSTAQTVTVTAAADDNSADISATIDHEVASGSAAEYADATAELPVSVTDHDSLAINHDVGLMVLEGSTREMSIRLSRQPTANVTVNVAVTGGLTVSADGNNYASTASVTFTPADSSTNQTLTLAAAQDLDSTHETETLTTSVAMGSAAEYVSKVMPATTNVIVADDDTSAGVTVMPVTLEVDEGDTVGATYMVVLDALPSAPVGVVVSVSESGSDVRVTPEQLVFYPASWNAPQTVTVTAVADDTDMADDSATVVNAIPATYSNDESTNALEYAALASVDSVAVSVVDDDRPTVSTSELSVAEGGTGTYTVVLNVAPASDVVIDVALADGSDSDVAVSPSSLTFTASGSGIWSTHQTVTVSAAEDDDSTDDAATVTHVVNNDDSDNAYDDVPIASVAVAVADNDSKVIVSVSELSVGEGATNTYTVKLGPGAGLGCGDRHRVWRGQRWRCVGEHRRHEFRGDGDADVHVGGLVVRPDGDGEGRQRRRQRRRHRHGDPHRGRRPERQRLRRGDHRQRCGDRGRRRPGGDNAVGDVAVS